VQRTQHLPQDINDGRETINGGFPPEGSSKKGDKDESSQPVAKGRETLQKGGNEGGEKNPGAAKGKEGFQKARHQGCRPATRLKPLQHFQETRPVTPGHWRELRFLKKHGAKETNNGGEREK